MADLRLKRLWSHLGSLQLTLITLVLLSILVVLCTLAQVTLGTWGAVETYMRSWLLWTSLGGLTLPVFPGGALVGLVLLLNLVAAFQQRFTWNPRKLGIWLVHGGLILLVAGEFVTGAMQVETTMAIEEGQTVAFLESPRHHELAIIDTTDPQTDDVFGVPESRLVPGNTVPLPGSPLALKIHRFHPNAELEPAAGDPAGSGVTAGVGLSVRITPRPTVTSDKELNLPAAVVEPVVQGTSYGRWLVSPALGAPQTFIHEGHTYRLQMRLQRTYLPYSLTLKDFRHDLYPGTSIPKNFSSLVRLNHPDHGESREVLISMNQPLRYDGRAFYQASFGKNDTLSVLQVVRNPGWLVPYVACILVALGLVWHFALALRRGLSKESR